MQDLKTGSRGRLRAALPGSVEPVPRTWASAQAPLSKAPDFVLAACGTPSLHSEVHLMIYGCH